MTIPKEEIDLKLNSLKEILYNLHEESVELNSRVNSAEESAVELEKRNMALEQSIQMVENEKIMLSKEREDYSSELARVSSLFSELSQKETDKIDAKEILNIYITLLETVFYAKPHARVLALLHGEKSVWNRDEITKSTGVIPAVIRQTIFELARAELLDFDEEKGLCQLKRRLY